jgi:KRAB domain-containing zinc finger protein
MGLHILIICRYLFLIFLCNDCGKSFVTKQKMQNHVRAKHTMERPYVCDTCGTGFVRSDKLLIHKRRVHTGERPYSCEHCDWRGVDSSDLIHHRKKHLKTLPSPSKIENQSFPEQQHQQIPPWYKNINFNQI